MRAGRPQEIQGKNNKNKTMKYRMKGLLQVMVLPMALAICAGSLQAQDDKSYIAHDRAYHAEDTIVVNGSQSVGWVRSYLLDDWFVQLQGGGQLYYGFDDREGAFKDRLTGNGEFYFGRRIFPMFGFRMGGGYGFAHGFITRNHYTENQVTILSPSHNGAGGLCGSDGAGNAYGGYYWDYDGDANLLIQKWKYYYLGMDVFLDLAILRGTKNYNPYRRWNNIVYGGVNFKFGLSEEDGISNHGADMHLGYILKCNVNKNWSVYADLRGSFVERRFDREWAGMIEPVTAVGDFVLNAQVGAMYKFHFRNEDKRDEFTLHERHQIDNNQVVHYHYVNYTEVISIEAVDTLLKYQSINIPTDEAQQTIDSLQYVLDSTLNAMKDNIGDQPLDSILLKQLLPYEMVFFELDKWDVEASEEMKIDKMARIMKAYPKEKFILTGSADEKTGTTERNWFLSHNRADVVYMRLVNEYGISPEQLERSYLGGIDDYEPFQLNRCTVIIMKHPTVERAFKSMMKTN